VKSFLEKEPLEAILDRILDLDKVSVDEKLLEKKGDFLAKSYIWANIKSLLIGLLLLSPFLLIIIVLGLLLIFDDENLSSGLQLVMVITIILAAFGGGAWASYIAEKTYIRELYKGYVKFRKLGSDEGEEPGKD